MEMVARFKRKPLAWIGTSHEDLMNMPCRVQLEIGQSLAQVQLGNTPDSAKPCEGFSASDVMKIVENYDGDTYRLVYAAKFKECIFVLHAFQKKSTSGIATPRAELRGIEKRFAVAKEAYQERYGAQQYVSFRGNEMSNDSKITWGSDNVFADLELPDAEELIAKAQLAAAIAEVIQDRGLTQTAAAAIMGADQSKVSQIVNGRVSQFSFDRLVGYLKALECDVEIVITSRRRDNSEHKVRIAA